MKHTEAGFWGMASGCLLLLIGLLLTILRGDGPRRFETEASGMVCLWIGALAIFAAQRQRQSQQPAGLNATEQPALSQKPSDKENSHASL